jgi:GT2 family glycosyltransferase
VAGTPVVAVCTNRTPAEAAEALAALAAQVPAERLAVVTSGLSEALVEEHRRSAPGPVLEEPADGLSRARNRALEWAGAGAAIAFVDDDAVVAPGWWDALCAGWSDAADDVGTIGGPIRPRWQIGPPSWISEPLLPALTLLDLGAVALELDPVRTTVYGANVSFSVDALRRIGGFDPAFGHSSRRVFFSEEDEAQRALAQLGFRVLYAPDMAVDHVIAASRLTRRSFVTRRFAYGRTLGVRRARPAATALGQVAKSGPGALLALAARDQAKFMERAVRASENAGVLAGLMRRRA